MLEINDDNLVKKVNKFIEKYGVACGGNWSSMLMSTIKNGLPDVYTKMEDRSYKFEELYTIIEENLSKF